MAGVIYVFDAKNVVEVAPCDNFLHLEPWGAKLVM